MQHTQLDHKFHSRSVDLAFPVAVHQVVAVSHALKRLCGSIKHNIHVAHEGNVADDCFCPSEMLKVEQRDKVPNLASTVHAFTRNFVIQMILCLAARTLFDAYVC